MEQRMFTEEEAAKLAYISVAKRLEEFLEYWEESGDFDEALSRAFPEYTEVK